MRMIYLALLSIFICTGTASAASDFNFISIATMKDNLAANKPMIILDIQVKDEFAQHHIKGSVATYAYPVKSTEEEARLDNILTQYNASHEDIVIVCPRGAGGAKRAYKYLKANNVPEEKLLILEDGMQGWPHQEYVESN